MVSKTLLPGSEVAFLIFFIPFWLHIGVPEQIKIHPKTRFLQEFASEEAVFLPLYLPLLFLIRFLYGFCMFFDRKSITILSCCGTSWRHFLPFQNHAFCRLPCMWSVFLRMCWNVANDGKNNGKRINNSSFNFMTKIVPENPFLRLKIDAKTPKKSLKSTVLAKNIGIFEDSTLGAV